MNQNATASQFREALQRAVRDEEEAHRFYMDLERMAPNPWMAYQIMRIRHDEAQHAYTLSVMLRLLG